jgi:hypothetical protein
MNLIIANAASHSVSRWIAQSKGAFFFSDACFFSLTSSQPRERLSGKRTAGEDFENLISPESKSKIQVNLMPCKFSANIQLRENSQFVWLTRVHLVDQVGAAGGQFPSRRATDRNSP